MQTSLKCSLRLRDFRGHGPTLKGKIAQVKGVGAGSALFERLRKTFAATVDRLAWKQLELEELDQALEELQLALIENDVALPVAELVKESLKQHLTGERVRRFGNKKPLVQNALKETLLDLLQPLGQVDLLTALRKKVEGKEPFVVLFVGVNGSGKTLTIAKVARLLLDGGFTVSLACSDTFRAGAIEQLEELAGRLGVRAVRHRYGGDAAAVAYDAIQHAKAHGVNTVLIDTAGRMQTKRNLMEEMRKVAKVARPDLTIFVGDALTGNDAVNQALEFSKYVNIDAAILTKMDADAKGGAAISITHVLKKPILYIGVGPDLRALEPFSPEAFVEKVVE